MQIGVPHVGPRHPLAHAHSPLSRQTPCGALHSSAQWRCEQSAPAQPASQLHAPSAHVPRPEHSSGSPGQRTSSHAAPAHRTSAERLYDRDPQPGMVWDRKRGWDVHARAPPVDERFLP